MTPSISFFIPSALWPDDLPNSPDQNWAGYRLGIYVWTVQTYLRLRAAGIVCQLTQQLPEEGIVLFHSAALQAVKIIPAPRRLLICMKADAPLCAIAPIHIVQNPSEASPTANRYYIPHWPQPQIISRDINRGDRFENLAFLGEESSLALELRSLEWRTALAERDLRWRVHTDFQSSNGLNTGQNDYHDLDAIVAVRSFNPWQRWLTSGFNNQPATPLYSAWLGGVVAILGAESAYRQTGQPEQGYAEVGSFDELLNCLDRLKENVGWRRSLIAQGSLSAQDYTPEKIVRKWEVFLELLAIPAYIEWCDYSSWQRQQVLIATQSASYWDHFARKARQLLATP